MKIIDHMHDARSGKRVKRRGAMDEETWEDEYKPLIVKVFSKDGTGWTIEGVHITFEGRDYLFK